MLSSTCRVKLPKEEMTKQREKETSNHSFLKESILPEVHMIVIFFGRLVIVLELISHGIDMNYDAVKAK